MSDFEVVVVDLETSSLDPFKTEICQISALNRHGGLFDRYVAPTKEIDPEASNVTGLTTMSGELFLNGQKVETTPVKTALEEFLNFLASCGSNVILAGHNARRFDFIIIRRYMESFGLLNDYRSVVEGFVDTLDIFRNSTSPFLTGVQSFSQSNLLEKVLGNGMSAGAHNAVNDVKNLDALLRKLNVSSEEIRKYTKLP